jgi:hypothetical protein
MPDWQRIASLEAGVVIPSAKSCKLNKSMRHRLVINFLQLVTMAQRKRAGRSAKERHLVSLEGKTVVDEIAHLLENKNGADGCIVGDLGPKIGKRLGRSSHAVLSSSG